MEETRRREDWMVCEREEMRRSEEGKEGEGREEREGI